MEEASRSGPIDVLPWYSRWRPRRSGIPLWYCPPCRRIEWWLPTVPYSKRNVLPSAETLDHPPSIVAVIDDFLLNMLSDDSDKLVLDGLWYVCRILWSIHKMFLKRYISYLCPGEEPWNLRCCWSIFMPTIISMLPECNILAITQQDSLHQSLWHLKVFLPSIVSDRFSTMLMYGCTLLHLCWNSWLFNKAVLWLSYPLPGFLWLEALASPLLCIFLKKCSSKRAVAFFQFRHKLSLLQIITEQHIMETECSVRWRRNNTAQGT